MFKKIVLILTFSMLFGCSAHIRESSFIAQDEEVINYSSSELVEWERLFPEHQVQPLQLVTQKDAISLQGLYLEHAGSKDVIFFIPGNGMKVRDGGIEVLKTLSQLGKSIVIFDRRGSGASGGKATIDSLLDDSIEQYFFIKNELKASSVVVHGFSLGSFVAGQLAKYQAVDALVLHGSATNVDDWIDESMPWYIQLFLTVEIDESFKAIDNGVVVAEHFNGPLFIIGGENDEQVPVELSRLLFELSHSANKKLMIVEEAGHGNMLDKPKAISIYKNFLESIHQ